jgi:hypothetical protein
VRIAGWAKPAEAETVAARVDEQKGEDGQR